ncbi:hypothetical protein L7F22_004592 [Adiantum nelumboides]|nr:hypothetical protein [Adiantum nelumboides]
MSRRSVVESSREASRNETNQLSPFLLGIASKAALKALDEAATDNGQDINLFRKDLTKHCSYYLSSKVLSQDKDYFANLAVDAVLRLRGSTNLENIQIIKKVGGKLTDSYLDEGFILDKKIGTNCPKSLTNAKILISNSSMDTDKIKIFGARVRVEDNWFIIILKVYWAEAGIMCIEHADFEGVERLALVTGGEIASTFDRPDLVKLGSCEKIEEIMIGEDKLIKFSGVSAGEACTVVLRGATTQMVDEAERSLHDALSVLSQTVKETRVVLGGGCSEMGMSKVVDEEARKTPGKKLLLLKVSQRL